MSEAKDHSAENVAAGLDDARATLAEIWRRSNNAAHRARAMQAMQAVISAEQTMAAADAFLRARTKRERADAFEKLRVSCILRVGHGVRRTP
jgi:conjugal transfer/entry exclusion protein